MTKYVFVTGGVVSSLGKGIAAAISAVPSAGPAAVRGVRLCILPLYR